MTRTLLIGPILALCLLVFAVACSLIPALPWISLGVLLSILRGDRDMGTQQPGGGPDTGPALPRMSKR
jgi:hypothetical protein